MQNLPRYYLHFFLHFFYIFFYALYIHIVRIVVKIAAFCLHLKPPALCREHVKTLALLEEKSAKICPENEKVLC